jgi:hypothetical protein
MLVFDIVRKDVNNATLIILKFVKNVTMAINYQILVYVSPVKVVTIQPLV